MSNKFLLTTAIPYVNDVPHIGHALELVQTDCIARYQKLKGKDVFLLTGSDENALKNVQAAQKKGLTPQQLCNQNTKKFQKLTRQLNVDYDVWRRGSDKKHHWPGVIKLWNLCLANNDIYKKKYHGYYCVGCESFLTKKDLVDGKCPYHQKKPDYVEEENHFFRLSKYQQTILNLIETNEIKITPLTRRKEILSFINKGLNDFSISRSRERAKGWGISVPNDETQIIYVWYDALTIYMTGVGFGYNQNLWQKWWPADLHIIGKDIIRFHAVYWISMLLSAKLPLPKEIFVHGFITSRGQKMSKSLGNVINPLELINKYGTDALRYYLLREVPSYTDGDLTLKRFEELYMADLANNLGNLILRIATMVNKYCNGKVPGIDQNPDKHPLKSSKKIYNSNKAWQSIEKYLSLYQFNKACETIWHFITQMNIYIDQNEPWRLFKQKKGKQLNFVLYGLLNGLQQLAWQLAPFLPETSCEIAKYLKIKSLLHKKLVYRQVKSNIVPGTKISEIGQLFPRI